MPERPGAMLRRQDLATLHMTHRCQTIRYTKSESPLPGEPPITTPTDPYLTNQPCLYYSVSDRPERLPDGGPAVTRRSVRMQFPYGADIRHGDIVKSVTDQAGRSRTTQPLAITGIVRLDTHIEVDLEAVGSV
jgi:hypothetical protein